MSDLEPEDITQQEIMPLSHSRILVIMAVLGVVGSVAGFAFVSARFGIGVFVGTGLAFANYYWLKRTLHKLFAEATEGNRPKLSALRYFTRYLALGLVIAFIYASGILPIAAVILGIAGFGFATVVEGFIRIFTSIFSEKEF